MDTTTTTAAEVAAGFPPGEPVVVMECKRWQVWVALGLLAVCAVCSGWIAYNELGQNDEMTRIRHELRRPR